MNFSSLSHDDKKKYIVHTLEQYTNVTGNARFLDIAGLIQRYDIISDKRLNDIYDSLNQLSDTIREDNITQTHQLLDKIKNIATAQHQKDEQEAEELLAGLDNI